MINIEKITKNEDKMCNHCNKIDVNTNYYCLTFKNGGISTQVMLCENCLNELQEKIANIEINNKVLVDKDYLYNTIDKARKSF